MKFLNQNKDTSLSLHNYHDEQQSSKAIAEGVQRIYEDSSPWMRGVSTRGIF